MNIYYQDPFRIYALTIVAATAAVLVAGALLLGWLRRWGCRQYIRSEGPRWHETKAGTPTLGGLFFVPPVLAVALVAGGFNLKVLLVCGLAAAFMLLGLADDLLMLKRKNNLGFRARHKIVLQFLLAALFLFACERAGALGGLLRIPFTNNLTALPLAFYLPFGALVIVGASNATNLTDGLDGLLAGLTAIAAAGLGVVAYWLHARELALFCAALAGGAIGFLFYNRHPARVFMGDTGSLAVGAALGGAAVLLNAELLLAFFGGVFFVEVLSVIIQVASYKTTRRRVFKMSPLHHHLELSGWKETTVVRAFWGISLGLTVLTLIGTYLGWQPS